MIILYQFATSPFCEKVRRILNYKGVPFEIVEVLRARVGELKAVSPHGKFPAIDDGGQAVWDSTTIAHHLEARFPQPPLVPADRRLAALCHVLEDWADESLYFYEMTMRLSWPQNIDHVLPEFVPGVPDVPLPALRQGILEGVGKLVTAQGLGRKTPAEVTADAARHFAALEAQLDGSTWLLGDALSLADIAVACQVRALLYAEECRPLLAASPSVAQWLSRVDEAAPHTPPLQARLPQPHHRI